VPAIHDRCPTPVFMDGRDCLRFASANPAMTIEGGNETKFSRMTILPVILAALWGISEATVFFILPDVPISYAAAKWNFRAGLRLALVAALAAAVGGAILWWYGAADAEAARALMLGVPAVGPDLLAKAHAGIAAPDWPLQLLIGAFTGTPYKLYAVEAGARGIDPWLFVALSIPARLARFLLVAALASAGRALFVRWGIGRYAIPALALAWVAVYTTYWIVRAMA
jgi:membrane protein YqaA with SNARE-associated domain